MTALTEYVTRTAAMVDPMLKGKGFVWTPRENAFVKEIQDAKLRIIVDVVRYRNGTYSVHFPLQVRHEPVEEIRNRFKVWPGLLSAKEIKHLKSTAPTAVVTYPKPLGEGSSINFANLNELEQQQVSVKRIIDYGLGWLECYANLEEVQKSLESEDSTQWPLLLANQRFEVLLAIYAYKKDLTSLRRVAQSILNDPIYGRDTNLRSYVEAILKYQ